MGELHALEPLIVCTHRGGAFFDGNSRACSAEKMTSYYLKNGLRNSACRFLKEFTSTVLLTVAAHSKLGEGVRCFRP